MKQEETNTDSAGSKPALKHVLVTPERHALIMKTLVEIKQLFFDEAKAQSIIVKQKGRYHNIPGQAEAVEYLAIGNGNQMTEFVRGLIQKAKGAQA